MDGRASKIIFHDDGRIGHLYSTSSVWMMRSIGGVNGDKDHFVFDGIPPFCYPDDIATSKDLTAIKFSFFPQVVKVWHASNTVEFAVGAKGNQVMVTLKVRLG
jgi:hypothetical protein